MKHWQKVCRGAVLLRGKKIVLVVSADGNVAHCVRLVPDRLPRHRADVILQAVGGLKNTVARCNALACEKYGHLQSLRELPAGAVYAEHIMQRIDAALRKEHASRTVEELPPGVMETTWRGPKWGDCGRKVGGAPSE
ncbi:hypothetical protein FKW31_10075 [Acetobacter sp. DmW_136]|uniref:hypothetical protein n=1 Tax=Acetobacter sp. DmW_136 TaxID=2591091 RepID=UPI001238828D|nr:hypothetical protein [Acetobacter sp. DmW_136]KAA8385149.1 hypothetical protein FKW31_10075 [Acetobacter sp. DmW_136]